MRKVNGAKLYIGLSNMLMISGVAARTMSLFWFIVLIVSVLFIVGVVPWCRQHENMWLFVLTAIGSVPINISLTRQGERTTECVVKSRAELGIIRQS